MTIPYRTQRLMKRIGLVSAVILAVLLAIWVCWMLWVQRYLVYSADGSVHLDFNKPPVSDGALAVAPTDPKIPIYFDQNDEMVGGKTELAQIIGYYADENALQDIPAVKSQIQALPSGTAVMIDVKNIQGAFFYSSAVGNRRSNSINTQEMDELIDYLHKSSMYAIARFSALRDYNYGLNNVPDGVHHSSGGYLYMDDAGCYWLNPSSQGTLAYVSQIIMELKGLGFDEVVLDDFQFPETTSIMTNGEKAPQLTRAADILLSACATDRFAVSFVKTAEFAAPQGRSRLYVENLDALQAASFAQNSGIEDVAIKLVFLTELHDTRFDVYSVMRPLSGAH